MTPETYAFLEQRKRSYQLLFGTAFDDPTPAVLDLMSFCRANETCIVAPPNGPIDRERTFVLEGRREVYLRIQQHLTLTVEQLAERYGAVALEKDTDP